MPMKTLRTALAGLGLAAAIAPAAAQAPLHPALEDRWTFGAGFFFPNTATQASLASNRTGVGTNVDFEEALDIERSKTVPILYGRWRINQRWRIDAEYFRLNRDSERVIDRNIQWGCLLYTSPSPRD